MVPRQSRETDSPLRPTCVYSMRSHPGTLAAVPQDDALPSEFEAATAVRRAEGGGLVAELDPGWDVGGGILNGGYLLAVIARAAVLDSPHPHPVAVSASYLRATGPGPATLTVTPGPSGRTLAHASVVLGGDGGPSLSAQVTTATLGDDVPVYSRPMPDVPPVEECLSAVARDDAHPVPDVGHPAPRGDPAATPRRRAGRWAGRRASR